MMINRGVSEYTHGKAEIDVAFPGTEVYCVHCRFIKKDSIDRYICILDPLRRECMTPQICIEGFCPLRFEGEENG